MLAILVIAGAPAIVLGCVRARRDVKIGGDDL
jgi:hypothetical protein